MAKKIAGEYIAELSVQLDKNSQQKQAEQLFNNHVSNLKKQQDYTVKQAEKTGEKQAEATEKGITKQQKKKNGGKVSGLLRQISHIALLSKDFVAKIPVIGSLASSFSAFALGSRFLSYNPHSTLDQITNYSEQGTQYGNLGTLLGNDSNAGSKVKNIVTNLQNKGLSKEQAINLISQAVSRTNNLESSGDYINQALDTFNEQDSYLARKSVAQAYGFNPNDLASLSRYQELVKNGDIKPVTTVFDNNKTQQNINKQQGASIVFIQEDVAKNLQFEDETIKTLTSSFQTIIDTIHKIDKADLDSFIIKLNSLDTQVTGYVTLKKSIDILDETVVTTYNHLNKLNVNFNTLNGAVSYLVTNILNIKTNNTKNKQLQGQEILTTSGGVSTYLTGGIDVNMSNK